MNLLCVDDEEWVLKSIRRLLKGTACNLIMAQTAQEALSFLKDNKVKMVISDFRMPDMNGAEFLTIARQSSPHSMHILLSSWTDGRQIRQAIRRGAINKVMSKPWNNEELLSEIHQCFSQTAKLID